MSLSDDQFTILDRETVYQSVKLRVDKARIALPNGNTVEWDSNVLPSFYYGVPVENGMVTMTREWRLGPDKVVTQFTAARCVSDNEQENVAELARELKEEMGLEGGKYTSMISFPWGFRTSGDVTYYLIEDYSLGDTKRDENEIQEMIRLPVSGLYDELMKNHCVTSDTLLVAKLLEESICK